MPERYGPKEQSNRENIQGASVLITAMDAIYRANYQINLGALSAMPLSKTDPIRMGGRGLATAYYAVNVRNRQNFRAATPSQTATLRVSQTRLSLRTRSRPAFAIIQVIVRFMGRLWIRPPSLFMTEEPPSTSGRCRHRLTPCGVPEFSHQPPARLLLFCPTPMPRPETVGFFILRNVDAF